MDASLFSALMRIEGRTTAIAILDFLRGISTAQQQRLGEQWVEDGVVLIPSGETAYLAASLLLICFAHDVEPHHKELLVSAPTDPTHRDTMLRLQYLSSRLHPEAGWNW